MHIFCQAILTVAQCYVDNAIDLCKIKFQDALEYIMSNMAIVEIQTELGTWLKFCDGSSHPSSIKRILDAAPKSQGSVKKARAIDS